MALLSKSSKLYAIVGMRCPRCHEGKLYRSPLYAFKGVYDMPEECPVCGQVYELEPGFFWGAMYIGYALSSGALLITAAIAMNVFGLEVWDTVMVVLIVACIGFLYNARLARAIWLNIYVKHAPNAKAKHQAELAPEKQ